MSLIQAFTTGTKLVGLYEKLQAGGVVGLGLGEVSKGVVDASYTVSSSVFRKKTITFFSDHQGTSRIIILPYYSGATNYCQTQGREVISGPFTGCFMSVYLDSGGTKRVGHTCTASGGEEKKAIETFAKANRIVINQKKSFTTSLLDDMIQYKVSDANKGCVVGIVNDKDAISFFNIVKSSDCWVVTRQVE